MTGNPSLFAVPAADFSAAPALAVIAGISAAPAYLGVFGGSNARALANLAGPALAPSTVLGTMPSASGGFSLFNGYSPEEAIQTNQVDALNWTWMSVLEAPSLAVSSAACVWGGLPKTTTGNNTFIFFTTNSSGIATLQVSQGLVGGGSAGVNDSYPVSNYTVPNLVVMTGASASGFACQNLTAGGTPTAHTATTTTAFQTGTLGAQIGTSNDQSNFPGPTSTAITAFWTSVLSSGDITIAAAWMRRVAAKLGITV